LYQFRKGIELPGLLFGDDKAKCNVNQGFSKVSTDSPLERRMNARVLGAAPLDFVEIYICLGS
jgi:hypothetical protein